VLDKSLSDQLPDGDLFRYLIRILQDIVSGKRCDIFRVHQQEGSR
jgi:hypothetical protein